MGSATRHVVKASEIEEMVMAEIGINGWSWIKTYLNIHKLTY